MQFADKYLGTFICGFASLLKRKKRTAPRNVKNILIIKMFGMGSIILMAPMVKLLRKTYPSAKINFLTFAANKEVVDIYQLADHVYTIRKDSIFNLFKDGFANLIRIRNEKIDVIFDAEFFSRLTTYFSFLAGGKFNVGFYNYGIYRGDLLDQRCYFNPYRHIIENFLELSRATCNDDAEVIDVARPIYSTSEERRASQHLIKLGLNFDRKIIVLNPNISELSPWIDRRWPIERFVLLGKLLLSKGYAVVVIGAPAERNIADALAQSIDQEAISLGGKISILDLVILLKRSFLLVTNDSGPLHIAASLGIPTFAFFGTDTPVIYGYNSPLHTIFYKNLSCSPCLSVFNFKRGRCDFNVRCISNITLEEVEEALNKKENFLNEVFTKRCKSEKVL